MIEHLHRGRCLPVLKEHYGAGRPLPEDWNETDLVFYFGSGPGALLYGMLFVPEFVEIEGFVFLNHLSASFPGDLETIARKVREARTVSVEAVTDLVSSYNWIEMPFLFANPSGPEEAYEMLAELVAEAWRGRLAYLFRIGALSSASLIPKRAAAGLVWVLRSSDFDPTPRVCAAEDACGNQTTTLAVGRRPDDLGHHEHDQRRDRLRAPPPDRSRAAGPPRLGG